MARKKENSVAALRDRPKSRPPMMVAPEREVPGINANAWAIPSLKASTTDISSTVCTRMTCWRRSAHRITNAPRMKVVATAIGLNRLALIALPKARPRMASGRKATNRLRMNLRAAGSDVAPWATLSSRSRYSQTTARMAPNWITISNNLPRSSLKFSKSPARIKCPVDEMGSNSVSPSTIPRMRAFRRSIGSIRCRQVGEAAFDYPGRVSASRTLNQCNACSREVPHISSDGCRPAQHDGRSGRPKIVHRHSASRWAQGCPAGLLRELIEGAMQQAPQPGRQSRVEEAFMLALSHRCLRPGCRHRHRAHRHEPTTGRIVGSPAAFSYLSTRGASHLVIDLGPGFHEFDRLGFHPFLQRLGFVQALCRSEVTHILGDLHRAEVRAAHRAEVGDLGRLLGQGLVVEFARLVRVETEVELVFPAKLVARLGHGVVADLRAGVALGEVSGVGGELVGDDAFLDVVLVGQAEVFLGRHVAEHGRAVPADHRGADAAGDVVVARRDVGGQRAEGVERGFLAVFELQVHVFLDQVHGHMARTLDDGLHIVLPGDLGEF